MELQSHQIHKKLSQQRCKRQGSCLDSSTFLCECFRRFTSRNGCGTVCTTRSGLKNTRLVQGRCSSSRAARNFPQPFLLSERASKLAISHHDSVNQKKRCRWRCICRAFLETFPSRLHLTSQLAKVHGLFIQMLHETPCTGISNTNLVLTGAMNMQVFFSVWGLTCCHFQNEQELSHSKLGLPPAHKEPSFQMNVSTLHVVLCQKFATDWACLLCTNGRCHTRTGFSSRIARSFSSCDIYVLLCLLIEENCLF